MKIVKISLLLILVVIMFTSCMSMGTPLTPEETTILKVIEIDKLQDQLFKESNLWMADIFTSAEAVIEYSDKEEGIITGKGIFTVGDYMNGYSDCRVSVRIEVKEGKARITFVALSQRVKSAYGKSATLAINDTVWDYLQPELNSLSRDYETYITANNSTDW